MNEVNVYINFALCAVLGMMGEADAMMRLYGEEIRAVAAALARDFPIPQIPLYRGVLLDPVEPYALDPQLTFLSWSEDQGVAEWFACPRSTISKYAPPHFRGYLLRLDAPPPRVLFHYAWAAVFRGLAPLALVHPHMGAEGARQTPAHASARGRRRRDPVLAMIDNQLRAVMAPEIIASEGSPEAALTKALAMARAAVARLADLQFNRAPTNSTSRVRQLVQTEDAARDLTAAMAVIDLLAGEALDQLAEVGGDITKLGGFS